MLARLFSVALLASSLLAVPISAGTPKPSIGVLQNSGFEDCIATPLPGVTRPIYWEQSGAGDEANPTVRCTSEYARNPGGKSAQFTPQSVTHAGGATTYVAEVWQQIPIVEVGQEITLTYWYRPGRVPEGADPSPSGAYNFSVYYDHDHDTQTVTPRYVPGSSTAANGWFYQYTATWTAPNHPHHEAVYLTLSFTAFDSAVYIYLDDITITAPMVTGDPQFVGLRGQSYQVHGIDGGIYNLVSSATTQINAEFRFLESGKCPIFDGIPAPNCWAHPGSYLSKIGIQQVVNGKLHKLKIVAGSSTQGYALVELDGVALELGASFEDTSNFAVSFVSSHTVSVKTQEFNFIYDNSDMFINQAVSTRVPLSTMRSHGLFGQTHQRKTYSTAVKYIAGEVDDYLIADGNIFGTEFMYNVFKTPQ